jgi:hypothetical protein
MPNGSSRGETESAATTRIEATPPLNQGTVDYTRAHEFDVVVIRSSGEDTLIVLGLVLKSPTRSDRKQLAQLAQEGLRHDQRRPRRLQDRPQFGNARERRTHNRHRCGQSRAFDECAARLHHEPEPRDPGRLQHQVSARRGGVERRSRTDLASGPPSATIRADRLTLDRVIRAGSKTSR